MKLEIDESHKKIKTKFLKQETRQIIVGSIMIVSFYTGALKVIDMALKQPKKYAKNYEDIKKLNEEKLSYLEDINISLKESNGDFSYLEYCTDLDSLSINCDINDLSCLNNICVNSNIKKIELYNNNDGVNITKEDIMFIDNMPNLKEIDFYDIDIDPDCVEELDKLETVGLYNVFNMNFDFNKFNNVKTIDFLQTGVYNIATYLSTSDYNNLIAKGINVKFSSITEKNKYLDVCKKLDDIVSSLPITKDSSDREKVDAVIVYVLDNLQYDSEIAEAHNNKKDLEKNYSFYEDGFLYGVFEKNTQICGNYSALVEALCNRINNPINSYKMFSKNHAWNLINIDGELYYVDTTWIDDIIVKEYTFGISKNPTTGTSIFTHSEVCKTVQDAIKEGKAEGIDWYMEDFDSKDLPPDVEEAHKPRVNIPNYMLKLDKNYMDSNNENIKNNDTHYSLENIECLPNSSQNKIKIKISNRTIECNIGALVGAMIPLGLAIPIKKKKEKVQDEQIEHHVR